MLVLISVRRIVSYNFLRVRCIPRWTSWTLVSGLLILWNCLFINLNVEQYLYSLTEYTCDHHGAKFFLLWIFFNSFITSGIHNVYWSARSKQSIIVPLSWFLCWLEIPRLYPDMDSLSFFYAHSVSYSSFLLMVITSKNSNVSFIFSTLVEV